MLTVHNLYSQHIEREFPLAQINFHGRIDREMDTNYATHNYYSGFLIQICWKLHAEK